ncbi:hypothetical protein D3272_06810 [Lichenibacterium ramalinae]|uniref:Uncharacterized protein n=2 Tax=Lichenibacterium ramalinae TaxID=2316527 RepID=A0A4Q2RI01_9HYPH|nr:hypothetical protein D3272_06810 [Lichenibacterium ramalinae]
MTIMATKNASGHQGEVKDPEHDGRLKGHKGGEAAKAHAEGSHKDEADHAGAKKAGGKSHASEGEHAAKADHTKADHAKADHSKSHEPAKPAEARATDGDADLKAREYTDAQGNVHHHTKAYMEGHKGG